MWRWLFKPRRALFAFDVNGWRVWRDPVEVRDALNAADPNWSALVDVVAKASKPLPANISTPESEAKRAEQAADAAKRLAELVSVAFDAPAVSADGKGLTRAERIDVLAAFLDYCREMGRRYRPLASPPPSTA